jgi:hypothetical protein
MEYIIPPQAIEAEISVFCKPKNEHYMLKVDVLAFLCRKIQVVNCRCGEESFAITKKVILNVQPIKKEAL